MARSTKLCASSKQYVRVGAIFKGMATLPEGRGTTNYRAFYKGAAVGRYSNDGAFMKFAMKVLEDIQPKVLVFNKGDVLPLQILEQCIEEYQMRRDNEQTAV